MHRRNFLKTTTAALAAGGLLSSCAQDQPQTVGEIARTSIERFGVGLFTIPFWLEQDFAGAIKKLAGIGYKEVELFGPYPYSVQEAKDFWNGITGQLGFSGSGYFGHSAKEVRETLVENGMTSPSAHIDLGTLQERLDEVAEAAHTLGQTYIGIAAMREEFRQDLDGYKRTADLFNEIGMKMNAFGLKFLYHNHGYGLVEMEGEIPLQVVIERTDPKYVALEIDIFWTVAGRADPVEYLNAYPGRFKLMHLKDMTETVHFKGDGGTPDQWMELFPYTTDAGSGVMDLPAILAAARSNGVEHFYLERDIAQDPDKTLADSYRYLSSLTFEPVG